MVNTRNILLVGRTGSGKSVLGNVLINKNNKFEEVFKEGEGFYSNNTIEERTVEIDLGSEKLKYRIIETIGIGHTCLPPWGVLYELVKTVSLVKKEGLNQILFVIQGRFTKEEAEAYDLLSSFIFDKNVHKYTTFVRTNFLKFKDSEACDYDNKRLQEFNEFKILQTCNKLIHVDNPPLKGRNVANNMEIREESRKRLLTHLFTCQGNYHPSNLDTFKRFGDYANSREQKFINIRQTITNLEEQIGKLGLEVEESEVELIKKLQENDKLKDEMTEKEEENKVKIEKLENLKNVNEKENENLQEKIKELEEKQLNKDEKKILKILITENSAEKINEELEKVSLTGLPNLGLFPKRIKETFKQMIDLISDKNELEKQIADLQTQLRNKNKTSAEKELESIKEIHSLKTEIKTLKINSFASQIQAKKEELEKIITDMKSKGNEETDYLLKNLLKKHRKISQSNSSSTSSKIEEIKEVLAKKINKKEIQTILDKQNEVINLEKQLAILEAETET